MEEHPTQITNDYNKKHLEKQLLEQGLITSVNH